MLLSFLQLIFLTLRLLLRLLLMRNGLQGLLYLGHAEICDKRLGDRDEVGVVSVQLLIGFIVGNYLVCFATLLHLDHVLFHLLVELPQFYG